ncbi:YALIA101S01e20186g1_1 [Yarrowia lipolytica]|nr:Putative glycosidase CRH1 [Yarrowia lipolytica]SEI31317.1 YALIA101S01e20186g1_1 [Yarrowia lipolytica]
MFKALTTFLLATTALGQTYSTCNPLTQTCKPDPALGGAKMFDFTQEQGDWHVTFKPDRVEYTPEGVSLRVQTQGDNPTLQSDFYLMFGRVEAVIQAAPGVGIVSSFVLQSDDLDEIDLEWLGGDNTQVQTNFFVKGNTDTYDRGQFHGIGNPTGQFHTYVIEWTSEQITWTINGQVVRTLLSNDWHGFPQSPMNIRMGVWAGGDPTNNPGTIQWAGGETNYQTGPYPMLIKSVNVEDYSTGDAYEYSDRSGTWQSIKAQNGEVHPVRPAVIPPADGSKFDLVSADQGDKPSTGALQASSTQASPEASSQAPSEAPSEASSKTSSEASSVQATPSVEPTSSIPAPSTSAASSAASSAAPTTSSTLSIPVLVPGPAKNTSSAVSSSTNSSTPVTTHVTKPANRTTSTVFATVTSCKDDACKKTEVPKPVANSTVATSKPASKPASKTVLPVTSVAPTTSKPVPTQTKTEAESSASVSGVPTISQATASTTAHQANTGVVTEASFGAIAVAAFALMLI